METLLQDLRYGIRLLAKNRLFTIIAVITIGLGVGANSAIFSAVYSVLIRQLPFENPDGLVRILPYNRFGRIGVTSWKDLTDWKENTRSFEQFAVFSSGHNPIVGPDGPEEVATADASAGFFELLGVNPILGRTFAPDDQGHTGTDRVAMLGEACWKQRFGSDPNIVGQAFIIDGYSTKIIGVIPDRFQTLVGRAQIWFPWPYKDEPRGARALPVIARLKPGVSIAQANSEMETISSNLAQAYPDTNQQVGANVESLKDSLIGNINLMFFVLFGAVGLVLLIACANVANLLLAKAASRSQEIAIRSALGASRRRLVSQFLTESLILSILGGGVALVLAYLAIQALKALNPGSIPRLNEVELDATVIVFTIVLSLVSTLLFGLAPALRTSRAEFSTTMNEVGRGIRGSRHQARVRSLLVITELAISLVVLIGAGLLIRSFNQLLSVNPGFNRENLMTATVTLPGSRYPTPESRTQFYDKLLSQIGSIPGAQSAALCTTLPLGGSGLSDWRGFVPEGRPYSPDQTIFTQIRRVSPGYFKTMQMPLLSGREFSEFDGKDGPPVVIVSQSMARRLAPDEDPIGKMISFSAKGPAHQVVGLVGDVKRSGLEDPDDVAAYVPFNQSPSRLIVIVARSTSSPSNLVAPMKQLVQSIDTNLPAGNIATMEHFLDTTVAKRRFNLLIFSILGGLALILSAIGTYGVVSYSVAERTQEIGIRMALGATRRNILFLVAGQAVKLAIIGVAVGLVGAFALTRILSTLLFQVSTTDPLVFVVIPVFLILVALVAACLPAIRATRVDPMLALRFQ
jgi:putative ABC transport system permease protein